MPLEAPFNTFVWRQSARDRSVKYSNSEDFGIWVDAASETAKRTGLVAADMLRKWPALVLLY